MIPAEAVEAAQLVAIAFRSPTVGIFTECALTQGQLDLTIEEVMAEIRSAK